MRKHLQKSGGIDVRFMKWGGEGTATKTDFAIQREEWGELVEDTYSKMWMHDWANTLPPKDRPPKSRPVQLEKHVVLQKNRRNPEVNMPA